MSENNSNIDHYRVVGALNQAALAFEGQALQAGALARQDALILKQKGQIADLQASLQYANEALKKSQNTIADWQSAMDAWHDLAHALLDEINKCPNHEAHLFGRDDDARAKRLANKEAEARATRKLKPNEFINFQIEIDNAIKEGKLYFAGNALPTDWYVAFKLWLPLAEAGDANAQYNIGRCYSRGDGIQKDLEKAKSWYLKAAAQKNPKALYNLYIYYSDNNSPEKNIEKSQQYFADAVALREPRALEKLAQIQSEKNKSDFLKFKLEIEEEFKSLIQKELIEDAKNFVNGISDERFSSLKDYFDIEIISSEIESEVIRRGQKKFLQSKAKILIKNYSSKSIKIIFKTDSYSDLTKLLKPQSTEYVEFQNHQEKSLKIIGFLPELFGVFTAPPVFNLPSPIIIPGLSDSMCFVLTACHGDENHPVVINFRNFRDDYLLKTDAGKAFIEMYYKYGLGWAEIVKRKSFLKFILRVFFRVLVCCLPRK